jgi:hypothetical protein
VTRAKGDRALRSRFRVEVTLAAATGLLTVVTLVSREWIELIFHVDPDRRGGLLEWTIVLALATAALTFSLLARAEWHHSSESGQHATAPP